MQGRPNFLSIDLTKINRLAVIGKLAKQLEIDGKNALIILEQSLNADQELRYADGYLDSEEVNETVMNEAQRAAFWADLVLIFVGFLEEKERVTATKLPISQNVLVEVVSQVEKNIVVIVLANETVEIPWEKRVENILFY